MKRQLSILALCSLSPILNAYELHEWGTFTTVSGSNGENLAGLKVEEEHLPSFVYSHMGMGSFNPSRGLYLGARTPLNQMFVSQDAKMVYHPASSFKGMPRVRLANVTVKMETPVIYFYGDDTPKVNVKVGFNGGTISQWYPQRKSGDTPNLITRKDLKLSPNLVKARGNRKLVNFKPVDFSKNYTGAIEWDVEILPKDQADSAYTFKGTENKTWIYPRVPGANMIKVGKEYEDYLFYRGIGNFPIPVKFTVDKNETLNVANNSKQPVPFAFAFENIGGKFRYKTIGSIAPGTTAKVSEGDWVNPSQQQVEVFQEMRKGLVAQGLSVDEANGMVKTWWNSYFNKPGLRVFWVVPQNDLERVLPLNVSPKPTKQVRVMVGRSDILRPKMEQDMIAKLGTRAFSRYSQDRFYLPYTNRLKQLIKEPVFQKFDAVNLANSTLTITAKKGDSHKGEGFYLSKGRKVKLQHLKLNGDWKIIGKNTLQIGDTKFTLDPKKGLLTANASAEENYDIYEIQLRKVLN